MRYVFALAGNQNSGKTTLFNRLTGASQHVGNWPGVTVEQKTGIIAHHPEKGSHGSLWHKKSRRQDEENPEMQLVDLPGIYSLSPYTMEEVAARDFITFQKPDAIINIVDATNLERNLYLTLQLAELETPLVVALNMMDEVKKRGDRIDVEHLSQSLGVPVVPICARNGEGLDALVRQTAEAAAAKAKPRLPNIGGDDLLEAKRAVILLTKNRAIEKGMSPPYAATKLIEGDERIQRFLALDEPTKHSIAGVVERLESRRGMERAAVMADARYTWLEETMRQCVARASSEKKGASGRLDRVLMNRVLAFPIFFLMMFLVFFIVFGPVGDAIADGFSWWMGKGILAVSALLRAFNISPGLQDLVQNGILAGVGSVLSFLPTLLLLFLMLAILEDSGYMARAAFLIDRPMRKLGLNGRSFIPLLMGFGCTVPAVMGARTLQSQRDRRFTILLTPLMSCGAKVPIYALFTRAFFPDHGILVMCCLYLGGILMAILCALALRRTVFHGEAAPFIMELPTYRMPSFGNVARQLGQKVKDFLQRAFTVILAATVVIWVLRSYTFHLSPAAALKDSMLGVIGDWIAPAFYPLGFGTAAPAIALLSGILAKESIVSTLSVLSGAEAGSDAMLSALRLFFPSGISAASYLTFVLLYMPCVAAFAAMRREMEGNGAAIAAAAGQTALAWCAALIVYRAGGVFL